MPSLTWLTREEDLKRAAAVPYRLLEADPAMSHGDPAAGNMLIQGDNLDALKALLPYYKGRIKCIYIDPPYNTRSAFEHYDDNLEHTQWLGMIYPRLQLLNDLLSDGGLIFASIDDREGSYLTVIMDEIFGRNNRINTVAVKMSEASGVKMAHVDKRLPKLKEWLLIYGKGGRPKFDIDLLPPEKWNEEYKTVLLGLSDDDISELKRLTSKQAATREDVNICNTILKNSETLSLSKYFKRENIAEKDRDQWKFDNAYRIIQAVGSGSVLSLAKRSHKSGGEISAGLSSTSLIYLFKSEFDVNSKSPRIQVIFADENLMTHPGDFWPDIKTTGGVGQEGGVLFPNSKKPEKLIQRVIRMGTKEGDIVLDSFLGSGTTAAVAHKLNRQWIGIEMGDHAETLCVPRLKAVIEGEQGGISENVNWQGGGGFTFYRLGEEVFDDEGRLRSGIKFQALAAHVWFSETGVPYHGAANSPFLGSHGLNGFALLYNGILGDKSVTGGNVLTGALLASIRAMAGHDGPLTIYGEASRIGASRLKAEGVTFKQTPYDVKAR